MTRRSLRTRLVAALQVLTVLFAGCAPRRLELPSGPSTPLPGFEQILRDATQACRAVDTLTAEMALSGRAGGTKLRGRVLAGTARPGSIRLEGVAPFGAPSFILAARGTESILLLPRDHRVLTGVPAAQILDALVGLPLSPDQMRGILTGCVAPDPEPTGGRSYGTDWVAVDLAGNATAFLRRTPAGLAVAAGTVGSFTIEYERSTGPLPDRVRIRSAASGALPTDLTLRLSQVEINVTLGTGVFSVDVPDDATPLSLEELRASGPLGQK